MQGLPLSLFVWLENEGKGQASMVGSNPRLRPNTENSLSLELRQEPLGVILSMVIVVYPPCVSIKELNESYVIYGAMSVRD